MSTSQASLANYVRSKAIYHWNKLFLPSTVISPYHKWRYCFSCRQKGALGRSCW